MTPLDSLKSLKMKVGIIQHKLLSLVKTHPKHVWDSNIKACMKDNLSRWKKGLELL